MSSPNCHVHRLSSISEDVLQPTSQPADVHTLSREQMRPERSSSSRDWLRGGRARSLAIMLTRTRNVLAMRVHERYWKRRWPLLSSTHHHSRTTMSTQTPPKPRPTSSDEDLTIPRDFGELWEKALRDYKKETGKDPLKLPFAKDLPSRPGSAKEVIKHFREKDESFKEFRDVGKNVLGVLETIVHFVHLFIDSAAEAAAPVRPLSTYCIVGRHLNAQQHLPGGKAIIVAVGVLLQVRIHSYLLLQSEVV